MANFFTRDGVGCINSLYSWDMPRGRTKKSEDELASGAVIPAPDPTAVERGALLEAWMTRHQLNKAQLARMTGLTEMAVGKYVRGELDIGRMQATSVTKLLTGMHVSDTWAWDYFNIPADQRSKWRSLRTGSMGAPESTSGNRVHVLDAPAQGDWAIPVGALVTVNPSNTETGLQLARVGNRYWLARKEDLPSSAVLLGQFKSAGLPDDA